MTSMRVMAGALGAGAIGLLLSSVVWASTNEIVIAVPNIPGPYCAYGAVKRLLEMKGVRAVRTSWEAEQIRIVMNEGARLTIDEIKQAMKRADYPYKYEIRMKPNG